MRDHSSAPLTLNVVLFEAGDFCIGVEAAQVRSAPTTTPLALSSGTMIEAALGLPAANSSIPRQWLRIVCDYTNPAQDHWLEVSGPLAFEVLPAACIHPLPFLIATRTTWKPMRALVQTGNGIVPILDLQKLLI